MDNRKAFDVVWHSGLFIQLYNIGIRNKMWHVIIDAYTGIINSVMYNGQESKTFDVSQSTRQGSLWGAMFYLVVINPLIQAIRKLDVGAYIGNIFSGVHVQADDIALVSTSPTAMQQMIDVCYKYSCNWRFVIHPEKTVMIHWGKNANNFKWAVGADKIKVVDSHTHCGILLSNRPSTIQRTKEACRKGRGIMASLACTDVLEKGQVNPITALKVYKSVVLTSSLFGCELWCNLTGTEELMLERLQRYCVKLIQNLKKQTRSYMCCAMLGLGSLIGYIFNGIKLKFLRRLLVLPNHTVSKQIVLFRIFQAQSYLKDKMEVYVMNFINYVKSTP